LSSKATGTDIHDGFEGNIRLTRPKIRRDIRTYLKLLDSKVSEERIHSFLASHSYFFNGLIRLNGVSPIYSKIKLGSDYVVDFVWFDAGSLGIEWSLAEIEPPRSSMFNKKGDPSAVLTHAIRQIRDWQTWVDDNGAYARQLMPRIKYPLGQVFIGRRSELSSAKAQDKLLRLAYEHRMFLRIHTLDWFAGAAEGIRHFVGSHGRTWPLPMKAYNHKKLSTGLPKPALEVFESPFGRSESKELLRDRIGTRNVSYTDSLG